MPRMVSRSFSSMLHASASVAALSLAWQPSPALAEKVGSAAACHAASRRGIPVFVVADSSKLLPAGFPQSVEDDRPPEEVWPDHGGVHVWNRYFEVFPISLVTRVVTEEGALDPSALEPRRKALAVPPALSAWAASRG